MGNNRQLSCTRGSWAVGAALLSLTACAPTAGMNEARATPAGATASSPNKFPVTSTESPLLAVEKTPGCGVAPAQAIGSFVEYSIATSGTKAANCASKD